MQARAALETKPVQAQLQSQAQQLLVRPKHPTICSRHHKPIATRAHAASQAEPSCTKPCELLLSLRCISSQASCLETLSNQSCLIDGVFTSWGRLPAWSDGQTPTSGARCWWGPMPAGTSKVCLHWLTLKATLQLEQPYIDTHSSCASHRPPLPPCTS